VSLGDKARKAEWKVTEKRQTYTEGWLKTAKHTFGWQRNASINWCSLHVSIHSINAYKQTQNLYCETTPWKTFEVKVRWSIYLITYFRH